MVGDRSDKKCDQEILEKSTVQSGADSILEKTLKMRQENEISERLEKWKKSWERDLILTPLKTPGNLFFPIH